MVGPVYVLILLVVSNGWTAVRGDTAACFNMNVFAQTYANLQQSVESLMGQMNQMRNSLDSTITASCGEVTPVVLPPFNVIYCNFEDGHLCNFTQDTGDSGDVKLMTGSYPDQTFGIKTGHYIQNHYASYSYHDRITSPVIPRSTAKCLRFFFRALNHAGMSTSHIKVYVKQPGGGHGYPILDMDNIQKEWSQAEVEIDPEYLKTDIQLQFELSASDYLMVDDIAIYDAHCSTQGIRKPICPSNYTMVSGAMKSCYSFHIEPKTWSEALLSCKKEWVDATLVAIDSAAEQGYLVNAIKHDHGLYNAGQFGYWTTGNDFDNEATFVWSGTHASLNYTNWHAGQPNNVGGHQNCLLMQYLQDFEWGDVDCGEKHPFICELKYSNI